MVENKESSHATREHTAFVLMIHKSKCNKTGPPEEIYLQQYAAPHGLCAASVLREYLAQTQTRFGHNLHAPPTSTPLFPFDWLSPVKGLPKRIFVDNMRAMLERAGIPMLGTSYKRQAVHTAS